MFEVINAPSRGKGRFQNEIWGRLRNRLFGILPF